MNRILTLPWSEVKGAQKDLGVSLIVERSAVVAVLHDLLEGRFPLPQIQQWASLVRWGYVATAKISGAVRPLDIEFEEAWEEEISAVIERLDEIGDRIDGSLDRAQIVSLLMLLNDKE
ncbi:hypothetical protein [Arthrobacter sp. RCC_34]|uniref:hypothetical protein n=1 Tax=Arthrobacter sp. RCC_34 TaxID=3239230 RepID=UPI003524EB33